MGSAGAIVLYYNLHLKNSIEYNNYVRTRVLEETRTFSRSVAFSCRSWGVSLIGLGAVCFCVVGVNLRGVVSIVGTWPDVEKRLSSCHAFFMTGRYTASSVLLLFPWGVVFFFVLVVSLIGEGLHVFFCFSSLVLQVSCRLSVRLSVGVVMLSRCHAVRLSLALSLL